MRDFWEWYTSKSNCIFTTHWVNLKGCGWNTNKSPFHSISAIIILFITLYHINNLRESRFDVFPSDLYHSYTNAFVKAGDFQILQSSLSFFFTSFTNKPGQFNEKSRVVIFFHNYTMHQSSYFHICTTHQNNLFSPVHSACTTLPQLPITHSTLSEFGSSWSIDVWPPHLKGFSHVCKELG